MFLLFWLVIAVTHKSHLQAYTGYRTIQPGKANILYFPCQMNCPAAEQRIYNQKYCTAAGGGELIPCPPTD